MGTRTLLFNLLLIGANLIAAVDCTHPCPKECTCNWITKYVNCVHNRKAPKLKEIPKDIPIDTERLSMKNNHLSLLQAGSFEQLKQLKQLYLQQCEIMYIQEDAFKGLFKLEYLDLSFNKLKLQPRHATFQDLRYLKTLKLHSLNLKIIPDQLLSPLKKLTVLDLGGNNITNSTFGIGFQNLTKLKLLNMNENNMTKIAYGDFDHLLNTSIRTLLLKSSNIKFIDKNAFRPLRKLQTLDLGNNQLNMSKDNFDSLIQILCATTNVQQLSLNRTNVIDIYATFNNCSGLTSLDLSFNNITILQNGVFNFANNLLTLKLNSNFKIRKIEKEALLGLQHIKRLHLMKNNLQKLPKFANRDGKSYIPHANEVFLDYNKLRDIKESLIGLENVTIFGMSNNNYQTLSKHFLSPLKSITKLKLSYNKITRIDPNTFNGLGTLQLLTLENNPLLLQKSCNYFRNLTNLTSLNLLQVNIKVFLKKTLSHDCLFKDLTNLEILVLHSSSLKYLPVGFFKNLGKLRRLSLQNNDIVDWNPEVFRNLTSLEFLDISTNSIHILNKTSFMYINSTLKRLEAYANPFFCTCPLTWFINWLEQKKGSKNFTFTNNVGFPYKCEMPLNMKGKTIFSYKPSEFECMSDTLRIILYSCGGTVLLLIILTVSFSYYFRWHIRYWCFLIRPDKIKAQDETERMLYEYDCYVAYSEDDDDWVIGTLLQELEQEYQFRVCVHQRNFDLGGDKAENADKHIGNSRKMLVVLTENFVNNGWCKFELDLGNAKRLDENKSRDTLIILMKEDVPMASMTPILRYLVRKKTYISWTEDYYGQTLFWDKVKELIHKPITANYGCHENIN